MDSDVARFGKKVKDAKGKLKAKGALDFLNSWNYELGHEILVPKGRSFAHRTHGPWLTTYLTGRSELFESGKSFETNG